MEDIQDCRKTQERNMAMQAEQRLERREFFKKTGITVAASALTFGGFHVPELLACGDEIANAYHTHDATPKKVLIAYASRAGSTAEVAEAIGQVLKGSGISSDVLLAGQVADVSTYRAAILGSAIRMGKWLPEATKLVERSQAALAGMPTAFFTVCMTMQKDTPENRRVAEGYMQPILQMVRPSSIGLFGGRMDYSRLGFLDRLIVSKMKKVPEGDYRDWKAIRAWASAFRPE
jgi:menaquinone-dependent protoporphyrinogen oxidase